LTLLATTATFTTPFYSNIPFNPIDSIPQTGGIVMILGALLYGINVFRANLDKERLNELQDKNLELEFVRNNLEKRVEERTNELNEIYLQNEQREARLQAVSEISQIISTNSSRGFQDLLQLITKSISENTTFYHVGIFLLDENREYAVLQAANSEGGKRMLESRHQLKVGGTGIVGYVAQSGRPRLALDTGADAVFFNNPNLPQTRSEMAIPLMIGAEVIGVLDVQSERPSVFDNEDLKALSTLSNQIALIIQNHGLQEGGKFITPALMGSRPVLQLDRQRQKSGFSYLPDGTLSTTAELKKPLIDKALVSGETLAVDQSTKAEIPSLAVPVKLRDQVIGIIHIESADVKRRWTEDEIAMVQAVSERAALALENANLFETAERRAMQEKAISEISSRIGGSNDIDRILQTTIQELGRTLGASRTFIQLGNASTPGSRIADIDAAEIEEYKR